MALYVERCLDSVFNQKFTGDFEVIIVDDCSTDGSLEIIKKYISNHSNCYLIKHEVNSGLAAARSSGIKLSKGEYIMHVDSDDWLLPDVFQKLYDNAKLHNADVIVFDYVLSDGNMFFDRKQKNKSKGIFREDNKIEIQEEFMGCCVNKFVKRSVVQDMKYGSVYMNTTEDLIYSLEVFIRSRLFIILPEILYVYFRNPSSLSSAISSIDYLSRQGIVYLELSKLSNTYHIDRVVLNNVNNYLNKFLLFHLLDLHLSKELKFKNLDAFFRAHGSFNDEISSRMIIASSKSFVFCLLNNFKFLGFFKTLKSLLRILF
jgi:glycosyltransferase involved in cell wall biosynthesis